MACKTCDHTMTHLSDHWFWCPRCGTIKEQLEDGREEWTEPKLVHRAFTLCEAALDMAAHYTMTRDDNAETEKLERAEEAVHECCLPPKER